MSRRHPAPSCRIALAAAVCALIPLAAAAQTTAPAPPSSKARTAAHAVHHAVHTTVHAVAHAAVPKRHTSPRHPLPAKPGPRAMAPVAGSGAGSVAAAVPAPMPPPPDKGAVTGLPLPRFASLRADDVNLRSGPGTRYPIQWVYHRRDLPVMVEREFDVWRLIEDMDGVKGWVNQATLVGSRAFVVTAPLAVLRATPAAPGQPAGTILAVLRQGVVGRLLRCDAPTASATPEPLAGPPDGDPREIGDPAARVAGAEVAEAEAGIVHVAPADAQAGWCRARVRDYTGWLPRDAFYGVSPGEVIAPS